MRKKKKNEKMAASAAEPRATLTADDEGDAGGQGGSKRPLLLKQVASPSSFDKVDGIPRREPGHQVADNGLVVVGAEVEQAG